MKKCSFSGDKLTDEKFQNNVAEAIRDAYAAGYRDFWCGMENEAELHFCEVLLELKKEYPELIFTAVIAYEKHASDWPEIDRRRYFYLMERCDREILLARHQIPDSKIERNEYMAKETQRLIVFTEGMLGNTMHMLVCAKRNGLEIVEV